MIEINNVTKKFDGFTALNNLSCNIPKGSIYGLVGSNGAGKSTLLRLITGIYKSDAGSITLDGQKIYENTKLKERFVFIPDELYFLPQANMNKMARLYQTSYSRFSTERFIELTKLFGLDPKKSINGFSKGMKRQAVTIIALSCMTDYIFFDETFDGLDPIMRNLLKKVIYSDVCERKATCVITSHSLRELEDTCDQLALLHKGGIIFESEIDNLKTSVFKVQLAFDSPFDKNSFDKIDIIKFDKKGSVANIIINGDRDKVSEIIMKKNPTLFEILPLSLEEVFIYEMESKGYSFNEVLM